MIFFYCYKNNREHALAYGEAYFGVGSGYSLFPTLNCNGTELDLIHCQHSQTYSNCGHGEDAGVRCRKKFVLQYMRHQKKILTICSIFLMILFDVHLLIVKCL